MATKAESYGNRPNAVATSGLVPISERVFEMPFLSGEVIANKYEVIDLVGVGGVGFVVSANHVELGERVALKFLRPEMLERADIVARFAQEALAAVRIKNEHVARVFDVGALPNGCPFIVMEYLEGRDLYDVVVNDGPQSIRSAVDYVLQACEALAEAHACGIVHRDIKPENLFLIQRSEGLQVIKVLDFGISKVALTGSAFKSKVPLVRTMMPMGSPVYMSPEQIRASKDIDARTDIWSLGCVLHELLCGRPAFDAPSLTQLSATILEENPEQVSEIASGVPPELDAVVARCLQKSPEMRFQNVAELALALYPFGPRRSRLSAERCCMLLNVDGAGRPEFELPSVRPPGWDSLPSGSYPRSGTQTRTRFPSRQEARSSAPSDHPIRTRRVALLVGTVAAIAAIAALAVGLLGDDRTTPRERAGGVSSNDVGKPSDARDAKAEQPSNHDAATTRNQTTPPRVAAGPERTASAAAVLEKDALPAKPLRPNRRVARSKKKASTPRGSGTIPDPDPGF